MIQNILFDPELMICVQDRKRVETLVYRSIKRIAQRTVRKTSYSIEEVESTIVSTVRLVFSRTDPRLAPLVQAQLIWANMPRPYASVMISFSRRQEALMANNPSMTRLH